jgi:xanthine dehydrogenase accessory factor
LTPAVLAELRAALAARRHVVLATRLADGAQRLLEPDEGFGSRIEITAGEEWFLHDFPPAPHLLLVGATHLAQVVAQHAQLLGFAVSVIDPRAGFNTAERFPGCELICSWPAAAFAAAVPDRHSAVVVVSHDAKFDDPALAAALRSGAFYVGALGSRKNQARRRARLAAAGFDDATLDRIHGPVGLSIGAIGAGEIAIAILAEIIAVRRQEKQNCQSFFASFTSASVLNDVKEIQ